MNSILRHGLALAGLAIAGSAAAQVTFYENEGFAGRSFTTQAPIKSFACSGFNDRASSVVVRRDLWEVCEGAGYNGRCVILRPGNYASLRAMGLNDRVTSVRAVSRNARYEPQRYAPRPVVAYDYRRRDRERLYQANVVAVRAVVGPDEQRCWVEREQAAPERAGANVPGAIVGAVIGGILGHQVGGGTGRDIATAGGVVVGAAIGANVGREPQQSYAQNVQRCERVPSQAGPAYWDVTYSFRGRDYRMQTTTAPGATVTVNGQGEPRA
ncbi:MAG TPA: beta/gamma crystallin-related protein [Methylibium sp.]|nr:beta/gamma crystallin-related protein [Methylibium sp.]